MLFYELSDNSPFERQWTVAVSIQPTSPTIQWNCDQCGRGEDYPAGTFDVVLEGGSHFPDLLLCGAFPLLIVSERVLSALRIAGVRSFLEYPIGISAIQDSQLSAEAAPRYFRLAITGGCMVDLLESGITVTDVCRRCGELNREPPVVRPLRVLRGSWDGSDVFRDSRLFPSVPFCTQKVMDVVRTHQFTNFRFDRVS